MRGCKSRKSNESNKGFSLIEIIIVIAIMAILVGLLAPNLMTYISKSRRQVDVTNANEIANSVNRIMASDDSTTGKVKGMYMMSFAWNKDATMSDDDDIYSKIFQEMGGVPKLTYNKDAYWIVELNTEWMVKKIYLVDNMFDSEGYEVYPDPTKFIQNSEKVLIK